MIDVLDHGAVRELRLNRPPVNALSPELLSALAAAVVKAPEDGARAVVFSGQAGMFSGGLDVSVLLKLDRDGMAHAWAVFFDAMYALASSQVPVAAAITGHSPAGGLVLALFCDWRVMADGPFSIGLNEVQVGIPMPSVVAGVAARVVGARRAELVCATGRLWSPQEAREMGLVDRLVAPPRVVDSAIQWCESMVGLPQRAMALTRSVVRRDVVELLDRHRESDQEVLLEEWFREDSQGPLRQLMERLKGG
jgi:enoyl-CoA hydratase/carnithine racemase